MQNDNWKFRSIYATCSRCMFFVEKKSSNPLPEVPDIKPGQVIIQKPTIGRCRRHSPCQVILGWPVVYSTDFCGDFKLDEDKENS